MDILRSLERFGLDPKQSLVYLKAMELGEASMTELARATALKRPTVYLAVEQLLISGLLSSAKKGKRKVYSAVHPRRLVDMARSRVREMDEMLPELVALYSSPKEKPKIQVFEGLEGMRLLYNDLYQSLNNKEEALFFTHIGTLKEVLPEALVEYKKMLRTLKNPKIRELDFGDDAGKCWLQEMKEFYTPHFTMRLLPTDYEFGNCDNLIFGNKLVMFSLKKDVFVLVIESEEIAKTYRALFEWAWTRGVVE